MDLFPDAVNNVILSKQSLFQISKIVAVGAAALLGQVYIILYIHTHAYIHTYAHAYIFLFTIDKVAGDVLVDDLTFSPRLAIAKILLSTKVSSVSMYVSMFVFIYVRMSYV